MIGSEETQEPRELLSAHESPEAKADVFADRALGGRLPPSQTRAPENSTHRLPSTVRTYPSKEHGAQTLIQFSKGVENSWTRQPQDAMGRGTSTTTRVSVPVSRGKLQIERAVEDGLHSGIQWAGSPCLSTPPGGRPNQLSGTQQHYPLIASRFALLAARISSAFFSSGSAMQVPAP